MSYVLLASVSKVHSALEVKVHDGSGNAIDSPVVADSAMLQTYECQV